MLTVWIVVGLDHEWSWKVNVLVTGLSLNLIYHLWDALGRIDFEINDSEIKFYLSRKRKIQVKWDSIIQVKLPYMSGHSEAVDKIAYIIIANMKFRISTTIFTEEGLKYVDFVAILKKHVPPEKIVENWNGGWF